MAGNIIDELAKIQAILTQIPNPNSHFNRWAKGSQHKDRVEAFSQQLGSLLQQVRKRPGPNNPPALIEFTAAVNRLKTNPQALNNLLNEERYAYIRAFFEQNRDFLKVINQAFTASPQVRPLPTPPVNTTPTASKRPLPIPPTTTGSKRPLPKPLTTTDSVRPLPPMPQRRPPVRTKFSEPKPKKSSIKKRAVKRVASHEIYVDDAFSQVKAHVIDDLRGNGSSIVGASAPIIVDPANAKTMNGNGGMSGAIKSFYQTLGRKKEYVRDILNFPKVKGQRCPNGDVKHTNTAGLDVLHTSAPDLRSKKNVSREGGPTDTAQNKLFDAYYNCFVAAAELNRNTGLAKELSCPLLGAGIFKWPMELSAEIAGKALQKFRETHGFDLQVNLYVHPSTINPDQSKNEVAKILNEYVAIGMRAQLLSKEAISRLIEKLNTIKKDSYEIYKPLSAKLQALLDQNLPSTTTALAASRLVQASLDKITSDTALYPQNMLGVIEGNITNIHDSIAQRGTTKDSKLSFNEETAISQFSKTGLDRPLQSKPLATADFHGKTDRELKTRNLYSQAELPDTPALLNSPLRTVYACLQAPFKVTDDSVIQSLNKLTSNNTGFSPFESVSKQEPNHIAVTSDPNEVIEWAEQLQEDLKGQNTNIIELQIPEVLIDEKNRLDNRVLNNLVKNELTKDLLKINQAVSLNSFKEMQNANAVTGQSQPAQSTRNENLINTNVPALYRQEKENSIKKGNKLHAFVKETIKSFGDSTTRTQQVSALQELVDKLNQSQPDNREQAMINLYSALQYVKHSISLERKLVSSSLEKVCNTILESLPKPNQELTSSQNVNALGKAAIEATSAYQKPSEDKRSKKGL